MAKITDFPNMQGKPVSVGEAAGRVRVQVFEAMLRGDVPAEGPRLWRILKEAAWEAKRRGVRITLISQGFLLRVEGRAQIVTFAEVDVGMLDYALDSLAPLPEEYDIAR